MSHTAISWKIRVAALAAMLTIAGTVASCKKEKSPDPPRWLSPGTTYYYDYEDDSTLIQNSRRFSIYNALSSGEILFEEKINDSVYSNIIDLGGNVLKVRPDGLYSWASTTCSFNIFSDIFEFLAIPANGTTGADIPLYGCGHSYEGSNRVLNGDTLITVPAGSYYTFYLQQANGDKSYWNRDIGIIQYERYQNDRAFPYVHLCTLKLRGIK